MIEYVEIINESNDHLKLELTNPWVTGVAITNITGLNTVKANVNMSTFADSDNKKHNSSVLDTRNITFSLMYIGTDTLSVEEVRDVVYGIFTPKKKVHVIFKTDKRFVGIDGYVESNEVDIFSEKESSTVSILCEDPLFYNEDNKVIEEDEFDFQVTEPLFEFEFSNESLTEPLLEFGEVRHYPDNVINYEGQYDIGLTIHIHCKGMVEDPVIYSNAQHGYMKLLTSKLSDVIEGSTSFVKGDDITIITVKGSKAILLQRGGVVYNILNTLDVSSIWLKLVYGENIFNIDAKTGARLMNISYTYAAGYLGI